MSSTRKKVRTQHLRRIVLRLLAQTADSSTATFNFIVGLVIGFFAGSGVVLLFLAYLLLG